ncbi:class I SAM-dependent methyltransferase [Gilvimarinus agarilyticus]|uniref:Cyclopropane-fatty-acyl-phospholipid synthase n=1 Tax=Reichenbachiella agariperforans TaxID=156994 RepID=A0A1M6LUL2_REIAG|nr:MULTISPECIES: class I SAM-dependent methyltransferase [Reichenbachiella]MBU2885566.1 class I SAM-dependent methyltransferase [Gilvimarinus agarilyticus]MBU2914054.1 class I SAM-dependent methyltransferase [Reichenbachiella agariperforans]RJE74040.1 cyclopropane-fatty-acyl-phospholipid synthase [Reichenbachiella sp. MSK19-1]SHJ74802.1 cyclopropane-fatty-acyl-phospholipid synthase [Reichenbachiella agariperforans]
MAQQADLDFTYTTIDKIFRLSMGETGDYSGAKYDGDFSMTLEDAQKAKHKFIADSLNIKEGSKVLDMACGWAPFTRYIVKERGATSMGLTLSQGQADACQKNGFNVIVRDCRTVKPEDYGTFDAITCIGGLEHFCSVEEWQAGKQEQVYKDFFKVLYDLLPVGGRYYMQTMTFSKNMLPFEEIDINAEPGSASHVLALMIKEFPGSWLPYGPEMVIDCAKPYFKLISQSSGRLDYIETIGQWRKKFRKFNLKKYGLYLSLIPKFLTNKEFRHQVAVFKVSPNRVCFEEEIMDHYRLVFEKI